MPPVFGPRSPSRARLKSCAGSSGTAVVPSVTANSDTSGPSRNSSITTVPQAARVRPGGRQVGGDHHALAGRQGVVLDHVRRAERGERLVRLGARSVHVTRRRGRDARRRHDLLGERLRPLDQGGARVRPEAGEAVLAQRVGRPRDQRRLRADHHQVRAELAGQRRIASGAGAISGWVSASAAMPGLPGAACRLPRLTAQRADDRVLAAPGPDDENAHASLPAPPAASAPGCRAPGSRERSWSVWSRRGPTPTALTGAPIIFSTAVT